MIALRAESTLAILMDSIELIRNSREAERERAEAAAAPMGALAEGLEGRRVARAGLAVQPG